MFEVYGKPLRLLILDVDGVIVDQIPLLKRHLSELAVEFKLPVSGIEDYFEELRAGKKRHHSRIIHAIGDIWKKEDMCPSRAHSMVARLRERERKNPYPAYPDAIRMIMWFYFQSLPIALCTTNSRWELEWRLSAIGANPEWFKAVSSRDNGYVKPDPQALDPIFEEVSIPREESLYVGDWYPDLDVALKGGVRFIGITSGCLSRKAFRDEGVPETHIIDSLSELKTLITLGKPEEVESNNHHQHL